MRQKRLCTGSCPHQCQCWSVDSVGMATCGRRPYVFADVPFGPSYHRSHQLHMKHRCSDSPLRCVSAAVSHRFRPPGFRVDWQCAHLWRATVAILRKTMAGRMGSKKNGAIDYPPRPDESHVYKKVSDDGCLSGQCHAPDDKNDGGWLSHGSTSLLMHLESSRVPSQQSFRTQTRCGGTS